MGRRYAGQISGPWRGSTVYHFQSVLDVSLLQHPFQHSSACLQDLKSISTPGPLVDRSTATMFLM